MSESEKWRKVGEELGRDIADGIERAGLPDAVRSIFAALFGKCRVCDAPLGGHSPEQICETCHAAEVLRAAMGESEEGKA